MSITAGRADWSAGQQHTGTHSTCVHAWFLWRHAGQQNATQASSTWATPAKPALLSHSRGLVCKRLVNLPVRLAQPRPQLLVRDAQPCQVGLQQYSRSNSSTE